MIPHGTIRDPEPQEQAGIPAGLRPYQQQAVRDVLDALDAHASVLFVAPTGSGKTQIFVAIAEARRPHGRILVLAHREELIAQAAARVRELTALSTSIEMAGASADLTADVVIASVQTLSRERRLARFAPDAFGLVIVDEAHHAVAATYRRVLAHFPMAKRIGATATADRLDRQALGQVFEVCPFVYELQDAIEDGWLCPIRQVRVEITGLDLSKVRVTAGDLNERDLAQALGADRILHEVAAPIAQHAADRPTLIFAVNIQHAHDLAEVLKGYVADRSRVVALSSEDDRDDRRATLAAFLRGDVQYLVNVALFTEGVDLPPTSCVALARPTASRSLYSQQVGRGCRLAPGKTNLLVLDYVGNSGRHRLVNLFDILTSGADAAVTARAQEIMNAANVTVLDAIAAAKQELAAAARQAAQEAAARVVLPRPGVQVGVAHSLIETPPFADPFMLLGLHPMPGRWGGSPMTDRQRAVLEQIGFPIAGLDRGQASEVIGRVRERREAGLATYRQARVLFRHGYDPDLPFTRASAIISALAANSWRRPIGETVSS
jgi:superfamily II DNA or RNA helicase